MQQLQALFVLVWHRKNTMEEVKQFEGIVKETMPKLYEVMR